MRENTKPIPTVTVIMPAYNAARFIEEAILSVVNQTFTDWELLVIDDGSKDETVQIAEKLAQQDERISVIKNEKNMGVAKTRNRGFDIARGEYIALLDSDDIWLPHKLEKQIALAQETGADIVYCSYCLVDEKGEKIGKDFIVSPVTDFNEMLFRCVFSCSTNIFVREIFNHYRFNDAFYHEDYVLWLELLRDGKTAAGCTEVLAEYRQISGSRASNKLNAAKKRWDIYRNYLKFSFFKSVNCFTCYAFSGLSKYYGK